MSGTYLKKVTFYRVMFLALVALCYFLYQQELTDYVIFISILVLFFGIFTISNVEVASQNVKIRKNYFWGLVGLKWSIEFDKITSLRTKEYEVDTDDDTYYFIGPKVKWFTTKLSYLDDGVEKDIELKMNKADYREIDRKIRHND
jgi:hypothetical protein